MHVIMFHSVGSNGTDWYRNWLSTDWIQFERFCEHLAKHKMRTIQFEDWYSFQNNPEQIQGNELVITFDDGYLDNLVFAYPILKKYGLCGTIFINPEFVDPSENIRPTLEDVWNKQKKMEELQRLGFLKWEEIKLLDGSRVMDIQSHSMSHNFYFHTDKIIDIYTGQPDYDWLPWYTHPHTKPFYMTEDQTGLVPFGLPVFEFYRALGLRRYFPDERLQMMGNELFTKGNYTKDEIIGKLNQALQEFPGRFETDEEMEQRYRYELFESKRILEEKLDKKIDFLCWPGGGYNELSINLSIEAGYKASTIASRESANIIDNSGYYKRIKRFGMGSFMTTSKGRYQVKSKNFLIENYEGRSGNLFYRNLLRARKLGFLVREKL